MDENSRPFESAYVTTTHSVDFRTDMFLGKHRSKCPSSPGSPATSMALPLAGCPVLGCTARQRRVSDGQYARPRELAGPCCTLQMAQTRLSSSRVCAIYVICGLKGLSPGDRLSVDDALQLPHKRSCIDGLREVGVETSLNGLLRHARRVIGRHRHHWDGCR